MKVGLIVYAYALRVKEPNPCNIRIAEAAVRIKCQLEEEGHTVVIAAQRSVAKALRQRGITDIHETKRIPGRYEGSEEVTNQAAAIFKPMGITTVIPVCQRFLQLNKCLSLVKKAGFETWSFVKLFDAIGSIGFDKESLQPGTRGLIRQIAYTVFQVVFGYGYPPELSEP